MVLRITVAFLEGPDQGGQHFGVNGLLIQQFFGPNRFCRFLNGLQNIRFLLCNNGNGILNFPVKVFFYQFHTFQNLCLAAAAAQSNEICLHPPHIIGLLWKGLPHNIRQKTDLLVPRAVAQGAVDHRQALNIANRHSGRQVYMHILLFGKALEALPILEARQQIRFQRRVGKDKEPPQHLPPVIFQPAHITPQGALLCIVLEIALDGIAVKFALGAHGEIAAA